MRYSINRSTFYKWYHRYQEGGFDTLANRYRPHRLGKYKYRTKTETIKEAV